MAIKRRGKKVERSDLSLDLLEETIQMLPKTDGVDVPLLNLEEEEEEATEPVSEKPEEVPVKFFKGRHPISKKEIYR